MCRPTSGLSEIPESLLALAKIKWQLHEIESAAHFVLQLKTPCHKSLAFFPTACVYLSFSDPRSMSQRGTYTPDISLQPETNAYPSFSLEDSRSNTMRVSSSMPTSFETFDKTQSTRLIAASLSDSYPTHRRLDQPDPLRIARQGITVPRLPRLPTIPNRLREDYDDDRYVHTYDGKLSPLHLWASPNAIRKHYSGSNWNIKTDITSESTVYCTPLQGYSYFDPRLIFKKNPHKDASDDVDDILLDRFFHELAPCIDFNDNDMDRNSRPVYKLPMRLLSPDPLLFHH